MQLVFISGAILGLVFAYFGIRKVITFYWTKPLLSCKLVDGTESFSVQERKDYTIFVTGGMFVSESKGYSVEILDQFGGRLELESSLFKQRLFYKSQRLVEFLNFKAEPGNYRIVQAGSEHMVVKTHRHPFLRVFSSKLPQDRLGILIRRRISPLSFGLSIALSVIGLQMTAWGIILTLNPQIFE